MMRLPDLHKKRLTRRDFIEKSCLTAGFLTLGGIYPAGNSRTNTGSSFKEGSRKINIKQAALACEQEPLMHPFGFKGGYVSTLWQTAALLGNERGNRFVGLGTQSVLWSDARVFSSHTEAKGNELMLAVTERALKIVLTSSFIDPVQLIDSIFDELFSYAKKITGNPDLRKTFVLNALVALDNAAWLLYAYENKLSTFDTLIPDSYKQALSSRHNRLAAIPLVSYNVPIEEVETAAHQGYSFMKIKIGQPGTQEEMLEKDKQRIKSIHEAIGRLEVPDMPGNRIPYYFDANGRYEKKETLFRLLDYLNKIGVYERIAILEEPFPEDSTEDVKDIDLRIAADESAHTDVDTRKRIEMGYRAVALKPIAKTLSMSLKIAQTAAENNVPCFCADLTVNPILVDWNKNVAARLKPVPELGIGVLESNGGQNYKNWKKLLHYHPCAGAKWMEVKNGCFYLDKDFYEKSGGIFLPSEHYFNLFADK